MKNWRINYFKFNIIRLFKKINLKTKKNSYEKNYDSNDVNFL